MSELISDEYLKDLRAELAGETGEKVIGKQTLFQLVDALVGARDASKRSLSLSGNLDRKGVELAWARATPLLKEHFGVQGTSVMVTAIVTLLAEPIIAAYLSAAKQTPPKTGD